MPSARSRGGLQQDVEVLLEADALIEREVGALEHGFLGEAQRDRSLGAERRRPSRRRTASSCAPARRCATRPMRSRLARADRAGRTAAGRARAVRPTMRGSRWVAPWRGSRPSASCGNAKRARRAAMRRSHASASSAPSAIASPPIAAITGTRQARRSRRPNRGAAPIAPPRRRRGRTRAAAASHDGDARPMSSNAICSAASHSACAARLVDARRAAASARRRRRDASTVDGCGTRRAAIARRGGVHALTAPASCARRSFFSTLPIWFFGSASTKWNDLRLLEARQPLAAELDQLVRVERARPGARTTTAATRCPHSTSGRPITAASSTPRCE